MKNFQFRIIHELVLRGVVLLGAFLMVMFSASAAHTRVTVPNVVSVELLGRGLMGSLNYDRTVDDHLVAGIGLGRTQTEALVGTKGKSPALLIPAYVNYYFAKDQSSLFVTGGFSVVTNVSDVKGYKAVASTLEFGSSVAIPQLGVGYENRVDGGFLFRGTGYLNFAKTLTPWMGLSIGYCF